MQKRLSSLLVLASVLGGSYHAGVREASATHSSIAIDNTFERSVERWVGDFAQYPEGEDDFFELTFGRRPLGEPLEGQGLMLSGNNHSDDLMMFAYRRIGKREGVKPDTSYDLTVTAWVGSNAQTGCFGIGGAPGEAVGLFADVVNRQPAVAPDETGFLRSNFDPDHVLQLGNLANGDPCGSAPRYLLLQRSASATRHVRSTPEGHLWIAVGDRSGFEGLTAYFIDRIRVTLTAH
jgi:hypothetical protein